LVTFILVRWLSQVATSFYFVLQFHIASGWVIHLNFVYYIQSKVVQVNFGKEIWWQGTGVSSTRKRGNEAPNANDLANWS